MDLDRDAFVTRSQALSWISVPLTRREREVAMLAAAGLSTRRWAAGRSALIGTGNSWCPQMLQRSHPFRASPARSCEGTNPEHAGRRVLVLAADRHVRVITDDGELLTEFTLDPTKQYQIQK